jgi:glutamate-1-semialdehyde 2,1-aminomutase
LKFEGHYHGWDDSVMVSYQPTAAQIESANGAPVPIGLGRRPSPDPVVVSWNDLEAVKQAFATSDDIAAIICEPLLCNCFCIPPAPGFLNALRELATRNGALLIFDEVITGYRIALGGAQELYGVTPDLATLGKAVGAGMPLSVLAGRREYMDAIVRGDVIHAGTLNGNPLTLSVADVALRLLRQGGSELYARLTRLAASLREGLEKELRHRGFMVVTSGEGAVFHLSFMESPASNYRDTLRASRQLYSEFAAALLDEGVLALPDGRWYISTAHDEEAIDRTLDAVRRLLA